MAVPSWILQSPLTAGIGTMEAGGRLGLAARDTDLREAAQLDAAREAEDRMGLSMQEMQQRREQAAAQLAQSLREQTALEQYRQSEIANQQALRQQAQNTAAATALHQAQQQKNWESDFGIKTAAEQRLEDAANAANDFTPGNAENITLPDGTVVGHRWQRSPRVWESVKEPPTKSTALTPNQQASLQLKLAALAPHLAAMDTTSPLYPGATNALAQANALLNPATGQPAGQPAMSDEDLAALFGGEDQSQEQSIPDAPKNPLLRRKDHTYKTPKGVFKWTGTGWQGSE